MRNISMISAVETLFWLKQATYNVIKTLAIFVTVSLLFATSALIAQDHDAVVINSQERIGTIRGAFLTVTDNASGGCWTELRTVRQKLQIGLEKADIAVFDVPLQQTPYTANIYFTVNAQRADFSNIEKGPCFGYVQMQISTQSLSPIINLNSQITHWESNISLLYQETYTAIDSVNFNSSVRSMVDFFITEIHSKSLSARRNSPTVESILAAFPGNSSHRPVGE